MSVLQYSKRQEERLIKNLESLGVEVLKHYGDREKDSGDVLARIHLRDKSKLIRFDHKSTQSKTDISCNCNWLPKLAKESILQQDGEEVASAAISISFYGYSPLFVISFLNVGPLQSVCYGPSGNSGKHIPLRKGGVGKYLAQQHLKAKLKFNDYMAYAYELSDFVFWVKESL